MGRWTFSLGALAILTVGGLLSFWLWRRGGSGSQVATAALAALGLSAVVLVAPAALGDEPGSSSGIGLQTATAELTVKAGGSGAVSATCPAGASAVGGGFSTDVEDPSAVRVITSQPTDAGWITALEAPKGTSVTVTVAAVCTSDVGLAPTIVQAGPVPLLAGESLDVEARCSAGIPLAVGWDTQAADALAVLPSGTGATVTSWARRGVSTTVSTRAICSATTDIVAVRADARAAVVAPGSVLEVEARCPDGYLAVGGGQQTAAVYGGRLEPASVLAAGPDADRYVVRVSTGSEAEPVRVSVQAVCVATSSVG